MFIVKQHEHNYNNILPENQAEKGQRILFFDILLIILLKKAIGYRQ